MLEGKIAMITGAGRGIGREIAIEMAKQRAKVIINYNGSKERAREVEDYIKSQGGEAEAIQCDVSQFEPCKNFIQEVVDKYKRVDILVNNAGITRDNLLMKMSEEDFDKVIEVNLKGTFHCMRFVSRQMLKQRSGRIINITSVVGVAGNGGQANYAASKAGVIGLTKSGARELASRGITVNAIAPGFIETDMTGALSEGVKEGSIAQIPLRFFGSPEDVAHTAVFLASQKARYITGQVIHVDGGMVM